MQRKLAALAVIFMFSLMNEGLNAQSKISGTIADKDGTPIAGANVLLLKPVDSVLVIGTVTAANGNFGFDKIQHGHYLLSLSFTGYQTNYLSVNLSSQNSFKTGLIKLIPKEKELDQVTLISRKPLFEQKIDRMIINVKNSITSAGGTALEVLEKSPGVIVNHQSNSIALSGKEGVVIMINGKISRLPMDAIVQMLSGMYASNIDRIELITTPPANFDAEGNAGFINIVLITNPNDGFNGTYSLTMGYGNGYFPAGSVNFNYRKNKINLYGDFSFTWNNQKQIFSFSRQYTTQGINAENFTESDRMPKTGQYTPKLGLDIQLTPKTILGFQVGGYGSKWLMDAENTLRTYKNGLADTIVRINNNELNQWKHYMGNINFSHTFKEGEVISADIDYLYYKDNNPNDYVNRYYDPNQVLLNEELTHSSKLTPLDFWVSKIDYTKKLSKKVNLESGVKLALSKFTNDVAVETLVQNTWEKDPSLTAKYKLKENIGAAYTSLSIEASDKTSMKLGLRYEYTTSNLGSMSQQNIVDRKYGRFFPSIFLTQKLDDKNSVAVSYSRRITRPTFRDMAPFVIFVDPYTFFSGNAGLQPAFSNIFKADYLFKNLILSVSFTREDNSIANFQPKISEDNKQLLASENLDNIKTVNISLSVPVTVTKWWNMQNNFQANWQQINAVFSKGPFRVEQKNYNFNTSQNFNLPGSYSIEVSGFYNSKALFGTYVAKPFGMANFGIQKKFKDNKSKLRFSVDDIFNSAVFRANTDIPSENIHTTAKLRFSYTTIKVTFTHNFGKNIRSNRNHATASGDEQNRVQ